MGFDTSLQCHISAHSSTGILLQHNIIVRTDNEIVKEHCGVISRMRPEIIIPRDSSTALEGRATNCQLSKPIKSADLANPHQGDWAKGMVNHPEGASYSVQLGDCTCD